MNGVNIISGESLSPSNAGDTNWKIMGTLDANLDGETDIVFQHGWLRRHLADVVARSTADRVPRCQLRPSHAGESSAPVTSTVMASATSSGNTRTAASRCVSMAPATRSVRAR